MSEPEKPHPIRRTVNFELWHVMLILFVQMCALAMAWGRIEQGQEDLARRMTAIESSRTVTRDEFDEWRADIRGRLDNIEQELSRIRVGGEK